VKRTAEELRELFDQLDREQASLIYKFWLLRGIFAEDDITRLAAPNTPEFSSFLAIREALFYDCVIALRRFNDACQGSKSSFRRFLKPLLPETMDASLIAELRKDFAARLPRLDLSFDDLLTRVRDGWHNFDVTIKKLMPIADKWVAHFDLKASSGVTAFEPHSVGTLQDNFQYVEELIPIVATLARDVGELIDLPNLGTISTFEEGGAKAKLFWKKLAHGLGNP
jgi:AbiU2